jgi:hypothetical protein
VAVKNSLARTFSVDLTPIRVHTDASAQGVAKSLSTRAFAYGNHIFLGAGEQATDLRLMAHEVAHAIQQSHGVTLQHFTSHGGDALEREAQAASSAATHGESFTVQQRASARPQGYGLGDLASDLGIPIPDPLDWLANKANVIPGFRMFTIVLGVNPINMSAVDRSAANILRALIEFLPGGGLITQALDNSGVFEKAGAFVEAQISSLGMTGAAIKAAVTEFIAGLSLKRIVTEPGTVWSEAERIFTDPIDKIIDFAKGLVGGIIDLIKEALLKPLAKLAEGTEGYNLLKGILGKDPITGETVERSAETLLGPLLKMIGLGDVWQKMQDAKAIPRAWAWFQSTMSELVGFVSQIPDLFIAAFKSLEIQDIILPFLAFGKIVSVFGGFMSKFVSWGVGAMFKLLEIVFDVVSPGAWGYVQKTGAALKSILQNPLPFVGNLARAAKLGFQNFGANFMTHLKKGLIDWLTGSLEGIYIPTALSLLEFGKMAISILGVSWAQIRGKLVKALGSNGETIMQGLEAVFDVVMALINGGPKAAWEVIKDKLTNLKDTIVQGIISFVTEAVVTKAIPKLIAMFIPGAGFITAIISIYDIVKTFIAKLAKIAQVIGAFVSSIVAIAAGNIGAAAAKVESVLGGLLSLAISFLAGFGGLGKVSTKVREVVNKIRSTVDKAIETAVDFVVNKAKALFSYLFSKGRDPNSPKKPDAALNAAVLETEKAVDADPFLENIAASVAAIRAKHGLKVLIVRKASEDSVHIEAEINPKKSEDRKLTNAQKLAKCIASRKHGKKVETVGHGNPKAAAEKAKAKLAELRKTVEEYQAEVTKLDTIRIPAIERLARARGVPEDQIPALTQPARTRIATLRGQIGGTLNGIKGIEHEEKVAKVDKAVLRNLKVRCVICKQEVTELDQVTDENVVLEAKASAAAIDVDKIVVQQRAIKQIFGETSRLVLALPRDVDMAAVRQKFSDKGVPVPEVRTY